MSTAADSHEAIASRLHRSCRAGVERIEVSDIGLIEYRQAWEVQRQAALAREQGTGPDTLLLLQHPNVYTAGRRTEDHERPADGTPVVDVDRGGKITWHGPGQLVGYPILQLAEPLDVVAYVRRLEEAMIAVCQEFGLHEAGRVDGRSGVWLPAGHGRPERKIGAIGIRVQRGITLHGIALNCNPDLSGFDCIVPCGIPDAGVSSLSAETGREVTVDEVQPLTRDLLIEAIDGRLVVEEHHVPRSGGQVAAHQPAAEAATDEQVAGEQPTAEGVRFHLAGHR